MASDSSASPSAPTLVDTTALPIESASKILMRVPLPRAERHDIDGPFCNRRAYVVQRSCDDDSRTRREITDRVLGLRPTIVNDTPGTSARMRGRISSTK
jgi:hypothetical protein